MPDWKRATKQIPFEALPSEMVAAINKHIEPYNLGPLLSDALICIQTDSEKVQGCGRQHRAGCKEIKSQAPEFGSLND